MAASQGAFVHCTEDKAHKKLPAPGDLVEIVTVAESDREGSIVLLSARAKATRTFKGRLVACRTQAVSNQWHDEGLTHVAWDLKFLIKSDEAQVRVKQKGELVKSWRVLVPRTSPFSTSNFEEFPVESQAFMKNEFEKLKDFLDDRDDIPAPSPKAKLRLSKSNVSCFVRA